MDCKANVRKEIPMSESLYMYANEYPKTGLDRMMSRHSVTHKFSAKNGHWVLELTGDDQNISGATSDVTKLRQNLISRVGEEVLYLPAGDTDRDAFKRLADQRIVQPMQVLVLLNAETGFRLIGPRDRLTQTKAKLLALAAELGLPIDASQTQRSEFLTAFGTRVSVFQGNLVLQQIDAIVNPANERLQHYGGAAKAISNAAGSMLNEESQAFVRGYGPLRVSEVMHTGSGKLYPRIKYVVHAVGPMSSRCPDPSVQRKLLEATFLNCLLYAEDALNVSSIAIPAIGSGIYGISKDLVAESAFSGLRQFETQRPHRNLQTVNFVNIDDLSTDAFLDVFRRQMCIDSRTQGPDGGPPGATTPRGTLANPEDGATSMMDGEIHDRSGSNGNQSQFDDDGTEHAASSGNLGAQVSAMLKQLDEHSEDSAYEKPDEEEDELDTDDICVICMDPILLPKELPCGHRFCTGCIDNSFEKYQPKCPTCGRLCGVIRGNQPRGWMTTDILDKSLPGYEEYKTLVIMYNIPNGMQDEKHPNPGRPYSGTYRKAYLPYSPEGLEVYQLLYRAFDARLIFTVGRSITTGSEDQVIWNDIHHKTKFTGEYGYPDPGYLARVKEELKAKGIVTVPIPAEHHSCNLL